MAEQTALDHQSRLRAMLANSGTWDLSPNDTDAIRYALGLINVMADELAGYMGSTVPSVIDEFSDKVARG